MFPSQFVFVKPSGSSAALLKASQVLQKPFASRLLASVLFWQTSDESEFEVKQSRVGSILCLILMHRQDKYYITNPIMSARKTKKIIWGAITAGFNKLLKSPILISRKKTQTNIISEYIFESENSENLSEIELVWDRVGRKVIRVMVASAASVCATRDRWDITRKPILLTCQTSYFKILPIWGGNLQRFVYLLKHICATFIE